MRKLQQFLALTALGALLGTSVSAQTISTIAGNGTCVSTGDGGLASNAGLYEPYGIAVDTFGNVYFTEPHRVRKVSADGTISTIAGSGLRGFGGDGGPATSARLDTPSGLAVDAMGNLYIADNQNHRIRRVTRDGTITTVAGNGEYLGATGDGGPATSARLAAPNAVAVDAAGNIYIADHSNARIRKVAPDGTIATIAGTGFFGFSGDGGLATNASLIYPVGIAVDVAGNVYFGQDACRSSPWGYGCRIRKTSPDGIITTYAGGDLTGSAGDGGPATSATLEMTLGLATDSGRNLFIVDVPANRIRKVTPNGLITTVAGNGLRGFSGDGGAATGANLSRPLFVAVDAPGNLYFTDAGNCRVRKVTFAPTGTLVSEATIPTLLPPLPSLSAPPEVKFMTAPSPACPAGSQPPSVPIEGEGRLDLASCAFLLDRPTVVVSHGWNPGAGLDTPAWMYSMASKIGDRANVVLWNWQERARSLPSEQWPLSCLQNAQVSPIFGCWVPYVNVPRSGSALASALEELICAQEQDGQSCNRAVPPTYDKPIHFVGHSLGSGVITYAVDAMSRMNPTNRYTQYVDQLTMLDSAYVGLDPDFGNALRRARSRGIFVDNYRSFVGLLLDAQKTWALELANTDSYLPDWLNPPLDLGAHHGYAYLWLTSSWDNFQEPSLLGDVDKPANEPPYGTAWSTVRGGGLSRWSAAPFWLGSYPRQKWRLSSTQVLSGSSTLFNSTLIVRYAVFAIANESVRLVQSTYNVSVGAVAGVAEAGQAGASGVQWFITKSGQSGQAGAGVVSATIQTVGDVGQQAAGGVTYALTETQRLSTAAVTALVQEAIEAKTAIQVLSVKAFDTASSVADVFVDKAGNAVWQSFSDGSGGAIDLTLNSSATMHWRQAIPAQSTTMRFGFEFLNADAGTSLEVFVDGLPVFFTRAENFIGKGRQLSEWLATAGFAGQTANILIRLSNPVDGRRATVRVDDVFFARVTTPNAPYAVATAFDRPRIGSVVFLDGSKSSSVTGLPSALTYQWSQRSGPMSTLSNPTGSEAQFTPTAAGTYQLALQVSDGVRWTQPAVITLNVPRLGDIDGDGDVDTADLALINAALNTNASSPNDLRDLDGDGRITGLDARKLVTLCTRPRCATQ